MIINKAKLIEKALENHRAVYIEGAAACGKSTAVNMFLKSHPQFHGDVIEIDRNTDMAELVKVVEDISSINDLMRKSISANANEANMQKKYIFVSRDKMPKALVKLLWAGQLSIIPAGALMLSVDEVGHLVSEAGLGLPAEQLQESAKELHRLTGGWPGCVSVVIELAKAYGSQDWKGLIEGYEVQSYIQGEIVEKLSSAEQTMLKVVKSFPFLCNEITRSFADDNVHLEILKDLQRKGILRYRKKKERWEVTSMFAGAQEEAGFDILTADLNLEGPQLCWLRAVKAFLNQDFSVIDREMHLVESMLDSAKDNTLATEIYLNLAFMNPNLTIETWLQLLEHLGPTCGPVRIYWLENYSINMLTGARELSPLFMGTAREEKRRKELLAAHLSHKSYVAVQLAKLEFDYETLTKYILGSAEWQTLREVAGDSKGHYPWRFKAMCLEIITRMQPGYSGQEAEEIKEMIDHILVDLKWDREQGMKWLKNFKPDITLKVTEDNYYQLFIQVRGYLQLGQSDRAGRILTQLVPYVKQYQRNRILAEVMFQQAVVDWHNGSSGSALKNTIESFIYTGEWHFVSFYTSYGQTGRDVMEAYIGWLRTNEPKKWQRKKRYNYGHVLKMPQEDYLETVLRLAKRSAKRDLTTPVIENLTMTEILVLQNINKGLSNAEICQEMNLKLPTVKTHIYNIYKKLGVGSRTQAIVKAKERGVLS